MTRNSDFKQVVRARMAETGESYTAALAAVQAAAAPDREAYAAARAEQERLVGRLFTDGRIAVVPAKRKVRAAVLLEVVSRFEPGRDYSEPEVNEILLGVHEDFAYLRRELVNYRYLERADGALPDARAGAGAGRDRAPGDPRLGGGLAAGIPRRSVTGSIAALAAGCPEELAGSMTAATAGIDPEAAPRVRGAWSARRRVAGGCTCVGAPSAATSAAATPAPPSTPPPTTTSPGTRSSRASSPARTGTGTSPGPSGCSGHAWPIRSTIRRTSPCRVRRDGCPRTGRHGSTDTSAEEGARRAMLSACVVRRAAVALVNPAPDPRSWRTAAAATTTPSTRWPPM